jgi:gluconate/galactonate dehydratase
MCIIERLTPLKITDVKIETIQAAYVWTFVRIHCGDLSGTGEAGMAPGLKGAQNSLRRMLVGEDAYKISRISERLGSAGLYAGTSFYHVVSAVNMALYDLIGKHLNVPVWRLLGGDRDRIPLYVDAHAGSSLEAMDSLQLPLELELQDENHVRVGQSDESSPVFSRTRERKWSDLYSPESYARRAKDLAREGYPGIKFDLDIPTPFNETYRSRSGQVGWKEAEYFADITRAVREAIGSDVELMMDFHWGYNLNSALRICKILEPFNLKWVEDLTPAQRSVTNFEELKVLAAKSSIPIATGENLYTIYQFKDLINSGVTIWTPDLAKTGGITEGRRISELAAVFDFEFSPHNISSPIGTMASAHLASTASTLGMLEFHAHEFPFWRGIAKSPHQLIEKGFIHLDDQPGLGVELKEDVLKANFPEFDL